MPKPQFFHIETYARSISNLSSNEGKKRSIQQIVNEALRIEGYCNHITAPQPAKLFYGQPVEKLTHRLEEMLSGAPNSVKQKDGSHLHRSIRHDTHVLLAGVYSYPIEKEIVESDKMESFFMDCIEFSKNKFGAVDSALLHSDESYYHIHVYVLSPNAKALHPGHKANDDRRKNKSLKLTYRQAMSALQDDFYQTVSVNHDMSRFGPRRERVARQLYVAAKKDKDKEMEFYQAELASGIESYEKAKLKKLKEAESYYLDSIAFMKDARHIREEIEYLETQLGDLKAAEKTIHDLQIQLALKDAVIIKYQGKYDDDHDSALMS